MPEATSSETLLTIIRAVGAEPPAARSAEEDLVGWTSYGWSRVLFDLPVDAQSFLGRFERSWDAVIDGLERWCTSFRARSEPDRERLEEVFGFLGLMLVTLVSLRHADSYRHRRGPQSGAGKSHDCAALCSSMIESAPVREALRTIYAPGAWIPDQRPEYVAVDSPSRAEWERIDFDSLRFHRHGTTSFILSGDPHEAVQGQRRPLALKCIVYPYLRVPTIVRATREYASRYGVPSQEVAHIARVWASSSSWILMDYVPGESLAEHLERRTGGVSRAAPADPLLRRRRPAQLSTEIRIDLLAELGHQLFSAMADLERAGLRHSDLSPSNIIVRPHHSRDSPRFVLVDLGVNYLYTHAMSGLEGPDSGFVAPEVRGGEGDDARADLYSIGQLLSAFAGVSETLDATVPDPFYAETPVMARFLEDLVDSEPDHRLLIFRPEPGQPIYPQLRTIFEEELAAMAAARSERSWSGWGGPLLSLVRPLAGAPGRQRRIWRVRRTQRIYRDSRRSMHVRWLLFWSWLSASAWYLGAVIVVMWWLRDLEWDWGNQLIALLQRATGSSQDEFPYLDALRAPDYPIPDHLGNLPVRMVAISFLLVGARYYQSLFAGLAPLVAGPRLGRLSLAAGLAEVAIRSQSVLAFVLVMPPTLIQQSWWPIFTAIGILFCFLTNWSCLSFSRLALRRARDRGLSTVPTGRIASLDSFAEWTPSSGFYTAGCWAIGLSIYLGFVEDVFVYAGAVTAINVVHFYMIKCSGTNAAEVRIGLGRAFLAAERVRYIHDLGRERSASIPSATRLSAKQPEPVK